MDLNDLLFEQIKNNKDGGLTVEGNSNAFGSNWISARSTDVLTLIVTLPVVQEIELLNFGSALQHVRRRSTFYGLLDK